METASGTNGKLKKCIKILTERLEGPRCIWDSDIKPNLNEIWTGLIWLGIGTSGRLL
jgi:hypothetical protein